MKTEEMILIVIFIGIIIKTFVIDFFNQFKQDAYNFPEFLKSTLGNPKTQIILIIVFVILFIYFNIKLHKFLVEKSKQREIEEQEIEEQEEYIEEFLNKTLERMSSKELKKLIGEIENKDFLDDLDEEVREDIDKKIKEAKEYLVRAKQREELDRIEDRKDEVKEEVSKLIKERGEFESQKQQKKQRIKEDLDLYENRVFKKQELTEKEIEILLEEGYRQVNEYCVIEKKIIPVLVKPPLNHTPTHCFLVWNVKQLLLQYPEIIDIREHYTREADLTFKIKYKTYAIEIETGNLLKKRRQLRNKVAFLKNKYGRRWMIVVSNRNLLKEYQKFSNCTQRKQVQRNLEKLIKN